MAYCKINKTGCCENKGNLQVRFDFFLEKDDPRYEDCHILVPDLSTEYTGKLNKDGTPVDQKDYDLWLSSLPKVYQLNPFHSHFAYFDPDVTDEEIKAEMNYHLPNFYKAYQDEWDKVKGGMRHGFAVEKRLGCPDYSKLDTPENYLIRKSQVEEKLATLSVIESKPIILDDGKSYPATTIDVGAEAIDRASNFLTYSTQIALDNPANATGTLDTVEIWANVDMTGTNKVGTFYGSSTDYTSRDYGTIGSVTAGSKQTFTGLSIDVTSGDYIGLYGSTGRIEKDASGYSGVYTKYGDQFGAGQQTYALYVDDAISLYATGETAGTDYPISSTATLSLGASSAKSIDYTRSSSLGVSLAAIATHTQNYIKSAVANLSLTSIASKVVGYIKSAISNIGLTAQTFYNTPGRYSIKSMARLSLGASATRTITTSRASIAELAVQAISTKIAGYKKDAISNIGLTSTSSKIFNKVIQSVVNLTLQSLSDRITAHNRTSNTGLGLTASVIKSFGRTISSISHISLSSISGRVVNYKKSSSASISLTASVVAAFIRKYFIYPVQKITRIIPKDARTRIRRR